MGRQRSLWAGSRGPQRVSDNSTAGRRTRGGGTRRLWLCPFWGQSINTFLLQNISTQVQSTVVVQPLRRVRLLATPWTVACQASLSFTALYKRGNSGLMDTSPSPRILMHYHKAAKSWNLLKWWQAQHSSAWCFSVFSKAPVDPYFLLLMASGRSTKDQYLPRPGYH